MAATQLTRNMSWIWTMIKIIKFWYKWYQLILSIRILNGKRQSNKLKDKLL